MDLYDYNTIKRILTRHGFTFSKALGQNFFDRPLRVSPYGSSAGSGRPYRRTGDRAGHRRAHQRAVCRVRSSSRRGTGPPPAGCAGRDLADCPNVQVVPGDVLQMDLQALFADQFAGCDRLQVCANLPYYITTPVLMRLLESEFLLNGWW